MTTDKELEEEIIQREIDKMKIEYPNWEVPDIDGMYCFSINQAKIMIQESRKETLAEVEKMIKEQYKFNVIDNISRDMILEELQKLKEKEK
jgi:hypothetical protein